MRHYRPLLLVLCAQLALAPIASARPPSFAETVAVAGTEFDLHGSALLRYKGIFKVYNIGLFLPDGVSPTSVFEDVPKRLEVEYLRTLSKDMIIEAGQVALEANLSPGDLAAVQERINRINALYEDVKEGDRYAITYIPGRGTELALNGVSKGVIEGEDFAAAYFSIWLGERAPRPDIRDKLLGGSRGS